MLQCLQHIGCPALFPCPRRMVAWQWQTSTQEVRRTFTATQVFRSVAMKWPPVSMRRYRAGAHQNRSVLVSGIIHERCKPKMFCLLFGLFLYFFSCVLRRVDSQRHGGPDTVPTSRICQQPQQRKQPQLPLVNRGQRGTPAPLAFWEDRIWWKWR